MDLAYQYLLYNNQKKVYTKKNSSTLSTYIYEASTITKGYRNMTQISQNY